MLRNSTAVIAAALLTATSAALAADGGQSVAIVTSSNAVDNQLLALKQKMGMLPAGTNQKRALGAGRTDDEETVHAEIEESSEKKTH